MKSTIRMLVRHAAICSASLFGLAPAHAQSDSASPAGQRATEAAANPQMHWIAVDGRRLSRARGGFSTAGGLELSLGIERTVSVNGDLVSRSTIQVADLRAMNPEQAQAVKTAFSSVNLIQNGVKNAIDPGSLAPGTFVQNTLNDQMIGTRTVISTTVNSAGLMKELNFMSSVKDASLNALGGR
ncbi:MAG: hypothetical protein H7267_07395 [Sandarakinorhabdus sp.]|nr:hypothetical protein [Sandarakinorhabdus sp.]